MASPNSSAILIVVLVELKRELLLDSTL